MNQPDTLPEGEHALIITHAQMRFDGPDDQSVTSKLRARVEADGGVYFTGPREADPNGYKNGWGCSRTYRATIRDALSMFMRENGQRLLNWARQDTDQEILEGLFGKGADATAARELNLYTVNNGDLHRQMTQSIIKALARRLANGTYDAAQAPKAWRNLADRAAQLYSKEHGPCSFNVATRAAAAYLIADDYAEAVEWERVTNVNRTRWTVSAIRDAANAAGSHFFDRETMRHHGDTLKSWSVEIDGDYITLAHKTRDSRWSFNPKTGRLDPA